MPVDPRAGAVDSIRLKAGRVMLFRTLSLADHMVAVAGLLQ